MPLVADPFFPPLPTPSPQQHFDRVFEIDIDNFADGIDEYYDNAFTSGEQHLPGGPFPESEWLSSSFADADNDFANYSHLVSNTLVQSKSPVHSASEYVGSWQDDSGTDLYANHMWTPGVELDLMRDLHLGEVMPKLRALLPYTQYIQEINVPSLSADNNMFSRAYLRLLSVPFSNGLAGFDDFPVTGVLQYLQRRFSTEPISEFFDVLGTVAARSFAESLLRCAMKSGQSDVVSFLLQQKKFGLDVNKNNIYSTSLLNIAAEMRDIALVRTLLKHGAAVNPPTEEDSPTGEDGPLYYLVAYRYFDQDRIFDRNMLELGSLLISAGAEVHVVVLHELLRDKFTDESSNFFEILLQNMSSRQLSKFAASSEAASLISRVNSDAALRIGGIFIDTGVDLSGPDYSQPWISETPRCIMDAAAKAGHSELVWALRDHQVSFTRLTLHYALQSGKCDFLQDLVRIGVRARKCHTSAEAITEAIYRGGNEMLFLLRKHDTTAKAYQAEILFAELCLASDLGQTYRVNALLKSSPMEDLRIQSRFTVTKLLGLVLRKALRANKRAISLALVEAGAEVLPLSYPRELVRSMIEGYDNGETVGMYVLKETQVVIRSGRSRSSPEKPLLIVAAEQNDTYMVKQLIDTGADVNKLASPSSNDEAFSPLSTAVLAGNAEMLRVLIEHGADVNCTLGSSFSTPLSFALRRNRLDIVSMLLASGANPCHSSALVEALNLPYSVLPMLIAKHDQTNSAGTVKIGGAAIQQCIRQGKIDDLKILLRHLDTRADVNQLLPKPIREVDHYSYDMLCESPLATAIRASPSVRVKAVQLLLDHGADPNAIAVAEFFASTSAPRSQRSALLEAIEIEDVSLVRLLIERGASVEDERKHQIIRSPLQQASFLGCLGIVELLLQERADPNTRPLPGNETALQYAACEGYLGIVELLLLNGANVNAGGGSIFGGTALESAANAGRLHVVQFLLQNGAELDPNHRGTNCAEILRAKRCGHFAVAEFLEKYLEHSRHSYSRIAGLDSQSQGTLADTIESGLDAFENTFDENKPQAVAEGKYSLKAASCLNTTPPSPKHVCQYCRKPMSNTSSLSRHIASKHSSSAKFECDFCHRSFKRKDILERHRQTHNQAGKVPCADCGHFFRKDYLTKGHHLDFDGKCKQSDVCK